MQEERDEDELELEDCIRPEDGLLRYWVLVNGEQYRLFTALAAAFFGVLWTFLYILGIGAGVARTVLAVVAVGSFVVWYFLTREIQRFAEQGWKRAPHLVRRERIEIRVAVGLWLFIVISVSVIMLSQWRHTH